MATTSALLVVTLTLGLTAFADTTVQPPSGSSAQETVNAAINKEASNATSSRPGVVNLASGTFKISAPILLKSNVVLRGKGNSTIIHASTADTCHSSAEPSYVVLSGVSNVAVQYLQFTTTASAISDGGHGDYRNCVGVKESKNVEVSHILISKYQWSDGVRVHSSSNVHIHDCQMHSAGHDGVSLLSGTTNSRVYNCDIQVQTNTGIRSDGTTSCELDHNTITGVGGTGWCCVEVENKQGGLKVHHNIFHDFHGSSASAGIGDVSASGSWDISDNVMWGVSPASQISMASSNIINPSDKTLKNWVAKGYGCQS